MTINDLFFTESCSQYHFDSVQLARYDC